MRATENEKRDWAVIALILLFGLLWILLAGGWALRFTPLWELDTNVASNIDPNHDFLTRKPEGFIEPVDAAILTNPAWINDFLTPGAPFFTATPFPTTVNISFTMSTSGTPVTTQIAPSAATTALATNTALANPTNTFVYFPSSPSSTPKPKPTSTSVAPSASPTASSTGVAPSGVPLTTTSTSTASATPSPTSTTTATPSQTSTPTATSVFANTPTYTPTATFTPSPTPTFTDTPTNTPTATVPSFCTTTIIITGSGSYTKPGGSTCFEYTDTFANGGVFQITSTGVNGTVDGSSCSGESISDGATIDYGVAQSGGLMLFRITGTAGTVNINISDWTTYPVCP